MPLWSTSNAVFNDTTTDTLRSKAFNVPVDVAGLMPSTKYAFYLDGIDYTWACKAWGKNLGDDLVSDKNGKLTFYFLYDFQYEGNYAFDDLPVTPETGSQYNKQGNDQFYYFKTNRCLELRGPSGSVATANYPLRLLIVPSHVNRIESHAH